MSVSVLIASDVSLGGDSQLLIGDRAAIHWGVLLAGTDCPVRSPVDDPQAMVYAAAIGAKWAAWERPSGPSGDLILIGPGAIQRFGDELAGELAVANGAELLFDVLGLERVSNTWKVTCDAGRGAREIVRVKGPLVIVVSEHVSRPPYVSRFRLSQVACPDVTDLGQPATPAAWQVATPRVRRSSSATETNAESRANSAFGIESGSRSRGGQIVSEEPAVAAQVLLRYLAHHGFVSRTIPASEPAWASPPSPERVDSAVVERASSTPAGLSPAILRGPRQPHDSAARMARRPRGAQAMGPPTGRAIPRGLRRAPRRIDSHAVLVWRGPFPHDPTQSLPTS